MRKMFLAYADPRIFYGNLNIIIFYLASELNQPTFWCELQSVAQDICQHLLNSICINFDCRFFFRKFVFNLNSLCNTLNLSSNELVLTQFLQ